MRVDELVAILAEVPAWAHVEIVTPRNVEGTSESGDQAVEWDAWSVEEAFFELNPNGVFQLHAPEGEAG